MTKTYKCLTLTILLVALASVMYWMVDSRAATKVAVEVRAIAQRQTVSHDVSLIGRVEPAESVTLTAPFDGEILQRRFEEGQYVEKGQVLVELSSSDMDVRLREVLAEKLRTQTATRKLREWKSSAELSRAKRSLANASQNLEEINRRYEETSLLYKKGIVAKMEVEVLMQQLRSARSEMSAAQEELEAISGPEHKRMLRIAVLEEANASDKYTAVLATMKSKVIVAPFSGVVLKTSSSGPEAQGDFARPGTRVAKGTPLLGLASKDRLRIAATVDEVEVRALQKGQSVDISGNVFGGAIVRGAVDAISSTANQTSAGATPRYDIKVSLPELERGVRSKIRLGMSASIKITIYINHDAIVIPINAVYSIDGKKFAKIIYSNKNIKMTPIDVISTTDKNAEIDGIDAGTPVVLHEN